MGYTSSIKPGDLVVCLDASDHENGHKSQLKKGEVYTVREVLNGVMEGFRGLLFVRFEEIKLPVYKRPWGYEEGAYLLTRFKHITPERREEVRRMADPRGRVTYKVEPPVKKPKGRP